MRCRDLSFFECWVLSQLKTSLSSFTLKRLFSSSSLSAIRVASFAYLRLLIFLPSILIPACDSSSLAFPFMYSAYKLNKKSDNLQLCHIPFSILNKWVVPCTVLTVASQPTYRFLRRQVTWSSIPISLRIFQFVVIHTVKGFSIVNEAEVDIFSGIPLLSLCSSECWQVDLQFFSFSKSSLCIWKFSFHVMLKAILKDFDHYLANMWNECNCVVVGTFFGIAYLWD